MSTEKNKTLATKQLPAKYPDIETSELLICNNLSGTDNNLYITETGHYFIIVKEVILNELTMKVEEKDKAVYLDKIKLVQWLLNNNYSDEHINDFFTNKTDATMSVTVRLLVITKAKLETIAIKEDRSLNYMVSLAVKKFLEDYHK